MEGINKTAAEVPQDLIDQSRSRLLETARFLRNVRDDNPDEFRSAARQLKIGLRKAYHLAQIDEALSDMDISAERAQRLGWTKLSLLAAYGKTETIDELLDVAEGCTAHELKMHIREGGFDPEGRTVVLHFNKEQYVLLEQALRAKGAEPHSRGLLKKEAALMRLISESLTGSAPAPKPSTGTD
ncbi:hypothetical protein [Sphingopyxis yananensis]|uniref:hypothetical protein n=1 Tax=Sphingopyxis yananensis TaxID=2886687 RepID=UPI001D0F63A1|nr:hypothetical protein [Sphingopyxis yananensis]MCC2601609.1 hypothetical protein [Sphingopyxis yananensis]